MRFSIFIIMLMVFCVCIKFLDSFALVLFAGAIIISFFVLANDYNNEKERHKKDFKLKKHTIKSLEIISKCLKQMKVYEDNKNGKIH